MYPSSVETTNVEEEDEVYDNKTALSLGPSRFLRFSEAYILLKST